MSGAEIIKLLKESLIEKNNYNPSDDFIIVEIPFIIKVIIEAKKEIDSNGLLILDKKGEQKKNPAVDIHKQYLDLFDRKIQQLGLTPYLRSKLQKMMATNIDDGFDEE